VSIKTNHRFASNLQKLATKRLSSPVEFQSATIQFSVIADLNTLFRKRLAPENACVTSSARQKKTNADTGTSHREVSIRLSIKSK